MGHIFKIIIHAEIFERGYHALRAELEACAEPSEMEFKVFGL